MYGRTKLLNGLGNILKSLKIIALWLIPALLFGGQSYLGLEPGEIEVMHFNLVTFLPSHSIAENELQSKVIEGDNPILLITQTIDMKEQNTRIVTVEKYYLETFELIESKTLLQFPPEAVEMIGTEQLEITAHNNDGKLEISSNIDAIPPAVVDMGDDLYTGVGSMVAARERNYEEGQAYRYRQINLINISGEPFQPVDVVDSVVSVDEFVSTPLGEYQCIKVLKLLPDLAAYTYYARDNLIPVLVEAYNRESKQISMSITIDGYLRK